MKQFIFTFSVVILANATVFGRPVRLYTYEQLFKEADLIVIATAIETKVTTDKVAGLDDHYVGRNTKFEVNHTLKGAAEGQTIEILHFKYLGKVPFPNAPNLVDFQVGTTKDAGLGKHVFRSQSPEYLLFLKRMEDGRYEPVSGQIDPVSSVRKVTAPPEVEKQVPVN